MKNKLPRREGDFLPAAKEPLVGWLQNHQNHPAGGGLCFFLPLLLADPRFNKDGIFCLRQKNPWWGGFRTPKTIPPVAVSVFLCLSCSLIQDSIRTGFFACGKRTLSGVASEHQKPSRLRRSVFFYAPPARGSKLRSRRGIKKPALTRWF